MPIKIGGGQSKPWSGQPPTSKGGSLAVGIRQCIYHYRDEHKTLHIFGSVVEGAVIVLKAMELSCVGGT